MLSRATNRRRKERINQSAFAALVSSPGSESITLPANGRIAFKAAVDIEADATLAQITSSTTRTIKSKGLLAEEIQVLDYVEKGSVIDLEPEVELLVDMGLGNFQTIAEPYSEE